MKILVDMNLPPCWCPVLADQGWTALHWSEVGDPRATDEEIMAWAVAQGHVVLTHDFDFGAILAATQAQGPSVIQIRSQDIMPAHLAPTLLRALREFAPALESGALMVVDEAHNRVRVLPISR